MADSPVVVATDLTSASRRPAGWGAGLARHHSRTLLVAHVVPPPEPSLSAEGRGEALEGVRRRLDEWIEGLSIDGPRIDREILTGDPADQIVELARRRDPFGLVVGSGRSSLSLGGVPRSAVEAVPCPVLVIHPDDPERPEGVRRILVATDLASDPIPLARRAVELVVRPGAEVKIRLVSAAPEPPGREAPGARDWAPARRVAQSAFASAKERAWERARRLSAEGFECDAVVREDEPSRLIAEVAEEWEAELLVLAGHGGSLLDRLVRPEVLEPTVGSVPVPALVLPV